MILFTVSTPDINITVPSGPLYAGAHSLTLTCTISLNLATDRDIRLEDMDITWLRGDVDLETGGRESISSLEGYRPMFTSQLTLTPLSTEDTTFTCRAVARPPMGPGFIFIDMSRIGQQTINVPVESELFRRYYILCYIHITNTNACIALPSRPPSISIVSRRELDGCGEVMTLNCTANQLLNLFSPPTIIWIAPDGTEVPTVESDNRQTNPQAGQLIFSDITPNNGGQYTCRAVVNIPEAQIYNYYDEAIVQINTNCEWL